METNDSGLPRVVRGAANRLEADYISFFLSLSLLFPHLLNSFNAMEAFQEDSYLPKQLDIL